MIAQPLVAVSNLSPLRVVDPISLQDKPIPERRWVISDWIPWGYVTALYGDGGTGKSLLAQQLMTSCAIGKQWVGLNAVRVRAFGVFCEDDDDELHRRQADINRGHGIDMGDLEDMRWTSRVGEDNVMMEFDATGEGRLTPFFGQIYEEAKSFGAQLIVIDTAADTFGGNENIRPQVRRYVSGGLGKLARDLDAAVLLCAHPSRSGMQQGDGGSTAWNNTVRSRLFLNRPEEEDAGKAERVLARKKANYSSIGDEVRLSWDDGAFRPKDEPRGIFGTIARRSAEDAFLDCLRVLNARNVDVTTSASGNYAPKAMVKLPEAKGFRVAELDRAMNNLLSQGRIQQQQSGPPSRPRKKLVEVIQGERG